MDVGAVGGSTGEAASEAAGASRYLSRVGGNKKGVFTRDGSSEAAAIALGRRWRGGDREKS